MRSASEKIYLHSPPAVQQLLVSLKGYSLEKIRRRGEYHGFLQEVLRRGEWNAGQFFAFQLEELRNILHRSSRFVPYYRRKFKDLGPFPQTIHSLRDFAFMPILEKEEIRRDPLSFVDQTLDKKKLFVLHTTGSTGTPLHIYTNETARRWNYAFLDGFLKSAGVDGRKRRATFGGRVIVPPEQEKPPFWRLSYFQKNLLFSSYHLTEKNLPFYLEKLRAYRPEIIEGYPSSLAVVAESLLRRGGPPEIAPALIVTSGETLFDEQRKIIEEAFRCKIRDQYGCVEMCIFAAQCPEGHYHYRPDYSLVEILKDNGEMAEPGETGEILCTGFINPVMPLIRYRIGDVGVISPRTCTCGLNTPYFEKIVGRTDDFIITPDGRRVGRLSPVLKGFPVKEAQYIQKGPDLVVVRLVKDDNFDSRIPGLLIKEIQKRLGYSMKIEIEFVAQIPRGSGGKLRTVISELAGNFHPEGKKPAEAE